MRLSIRRKVILGILAPAIRARYVLTTLLSQNLSPGEALRRLNADSASGLSAPVIQRKLGVPHAWSQ